MPHPSDKEDHDSIEPAPPVPKDDPYCANTKNYQVDTKARRQNANTALGDDEEEKRGSRPMIDALFDLDCNFSDTEESVSISSPCRQVLNNHKSVSSKHMAKYPNYAKFN